MMQMNGAGQAPMPYAREMPQVETQRLTAVETEIGYVARVVDEEMKALQGVVELLSARLELVLTQETPTPSGPNDKQAGRAVSSRIGTSLLVHAGELRALRDRISYLTSRLAV